MSDYPYSFDAKIVRYGFGKVTFSVVYVPKEISSQLDFSKSKRLRIDGEIEGIRIEAALMPTKGKWHLMVSKKLQKLCGVSLGDRVSVSFEVASQDAVTVPRELQFALEANEAAREVWDGLTAGKRRGFCCRVDSAKMIETRERRVEAVLDTLLGQGK
ncbi:MAG: YdeI/OmpD-associated family protein [Rubripirellula sp.]